MDRQKPRYVSYLLRLWCTTTERKPVWRGSLQSVASGERRSFADLDMLWAYLKAQTAEQEDSRHPEPG